MGGRDGILLTGEPISAQERCSVGLVSKVVPRRQVMVEAMRYAQILAENGPVAVQAVKQSVLAGSRPLDQDALAKEMELGIPVSSTEDARRDRAFKEAQARLQGAERPFRAGARRRAGIHADRSQPEVSCRERDDL